MKRVGSGLKFLPSLPNDLSVILLHRHRLHRYWTPRSRRIETVRPDINGRFSFSGLPAGEYVVAVAGPDLFGRPVSSMLRILQSGSIVTTLRDGEKKMLDLQVR